MKITLTFFSTILILFSLNAQQLVDEGNQWNIAIYPTFSPNTSSYSVKIGGDTVLNSQDYNLVYYSNDSLNTVWNLANIFLRQDSSKQVFYKEGNSDEGLLYDFNLQINDTFEIDEFCVLKVIEIDSVYLNNGEIRKRLKLGVKGNPDWGTEYWIDGIGSNFGVISHFWFCYYDYSEGFLCFYQNEELMYPENLPTCFITGIEELDLDSGINIYPSPFFDNLILEDKSLTIKSYILLNNLGESILKGKINGATVSIETSNVSTGFYYLLLENKDGRKYSKKLIKL